MFVSYDLIASCIPPGQIRYMNEDPKMHGVEKAGGLSLGRLGAGCFGGVVLRFWLDVGVYWEPRGILRGNFRALGGPRDSF